MKEGDVIQALDDLPLHFIDCRRAPCHTEAELGCPPILFDKVEFAVIFGIEIANMPTGLNQLLKLGLLRDKVGLQKKNPSAAAVSVSRRTTKSWALSKQFSSLWPKTALPNDDLHALEPAGHGGMIVREIKRLVFTIWEHAAAHAWAIRVVRPAFLRSYERSQLDG